MKLHGLVLAGGQSRRMGQDKAALGVGGRTLLARAVDLVSEVCAETWVSVRELTREGERARYAQIADQHGGLGPADGIVSAQLEYPDAAWLVVACDLPRLGKATLDSLVAGRDRSCQATAFTGYQDLPEPLCAIYEPAAAASMAAYLADDVRCPRKMLLGMDVCLLPPAANNELVNANTPEQWQAIVDTGV